MAPRHRSASKTHTPMSGLTDTLISGVWSRKGIAVASATGIALTATVAGSALADPLSPSVKESKTDDFSANLEADDSVTLVSLDVDWNPGDEVAVVAAEPEPEPEVVEAAADEDGGDVANRDYDRSDATESVSAPAAMGGVAQTALQYVGYAYAWAGDSPATGFDCSGFTSYVYGLHGVYLPHSSSAQGGYGTVIPASEAQAGDLVIWPYGHTAIYLGNGQIVHAATPSSGVTTDGLFGSYYFVRI